MDYMKFNSTRAGLTNEELAVEALHAAVMISDEADSGEVLAIAEQLYCWLVEKR